MKKNVITVLLIIAVIVSIPSFAFANMAAPEEADIGSSVTFEKNNEISVLSEVLNITVSGQTADITAVYQMKNTSGTSVVTPSMFLSPNIERAGVSVTVNNIPAEFTVKSYMLNYDTQINTQSWQYAVLTDENNTGNGSGQTVDAVSFEMSFEANEEYEVKVSYSYALGGYPTLNYSAKMAEIEYYLVPAAMWKDFSGLTINLQLDKDMPVITESSLKFEKTGKRTYCYKSDTLPEQNLKLTIDQNGWQSFVGTLKSPYLFHNVVMFLPFIFLAAVIIILAVVIIVRLKKQKKAKEHT